MTFQSKIKILLFSFLSAANAFAGPIEDFRKANLNSASIETFQDIEKDLEKEKDKLLPSDKAKLHFGLGVKFYELGNDEKAQHHLSEALRLGFAVNEVASYYRGLSYARTGKISGAKVEFNQVSKSRKKNHLRQKAQFELAKILLDEKKYKSAKSLLRYVERRTRRDPEYPDVLWTLIRAEKESGPVSRTCRWAKKLYSRQPQYAKIADWTLDPLTMTFDKQRLPCTVTLSEKKRRIRNLVLTGLSDKAKKDLDLYVEKYSKVSKYQTDTLLAHYYILEGYTTEAFQLLAPYYPTFHNNYDYLLLLAKAAVRSSEYQTAVGAYHKAHKLRQRSKSGRLALYKAAFLSYQFQDYDGAGRKFEDFIKKYSRSGLTRDAYWHLAWIRYLKKDYKGALAGFEKLKRFRGMAKQDRVIYWKAMAYYHLDEREKAKKHFELLINPKSPTFYSIAALSRLHKLNERPELRQIAVAGDPNIEETVADSIKDVSGEEIAAENEAQESEASLEAIDEVAEKEQEESEEVADKEQEKEDLSIENIVQLDVLESQEKEVEQKDEISTFSNSTANRYYGRAKDLMDLGFYDLAKWELYYAERATKNPAELRKLISVYKEIEAYNRISHIASNLFAKDRHRLGLDGAKDLWQGAFPKAYAKSVEAQASANDIDSYFVWSIMRAESNFKPDVKSPVGATGLMQLMPYTAERVAALIEDTVTTDDLVIPEKNIRLGTTYLARLYHMFSNQVVLAAAGYNAGPHRVKAWVNSFGNLDMDEFIEHIPFVETRNYVKRVTQNFFIYSHLYEAKQAKLSWLSEPLAYKFAGRVPTREEW